MMHSEQSAFQKQNRAKLQPPAPMSERRDYRPVQPVPERKEPAKLHEEKVVVKETEERIQEGEADEHIKETERRSLEQARKGWELGEELKGKLDAGALTEAEFQRMYWNPLADIRSDLMNLQSYAQTLPEGARRKALMQTIYTSIASIENVIHEGDLEIHRQETEKRRKAVEQNWSLSPVKDAGEKHLQQIERRRYGNTGSPKQPPAKTPGWWATFKSWF